MHTQKQKYGGSPGTRVMPRLGFDRAWDTLELRPEDYDTREHTTPETPISLKGAVFDVSR